MYLIYAIAGLLITEIFRIFAGTIRVIRPLRDS
jgi:hypothetical protein